MYEKGELLIEGKTKRIFTEKTRQDTVIIENKDDITAFDDSEFTKQFGSKGLSATNTTCRTFELLQKAGIPVAYAEQIGPLEFAARKCKMIQLEVIIRRYAVGSYLKRHPEFTTEGNVPHRFHRLVFELFLKTTDGKILDLEGSVCGQTPDNQEKKKPIEDPFISNPADEVWNLKHPKYPEWDLLSELMCPVFRSNILPKKILIEDIEKLTRKAFLVLESAFNSSGYRLIDYKIEFGITSSGELVISDVIDNDSWRLCDPEWIEMSKEAFRQGEKISNVERKYGIVTNLVQGFRVPKQVIVLWGGSENDEDNFPKVPEIAGIDAVKIFKSGHKSPGESIAKLEDVIAAYPEGGVILTLVGMSNGLGPTLAARTSWPVISVPLTAKENPHDIWSSLEMPSQVPNTTVLSPKNAVLAALNILAQKNPIARMHRQYAIEELDRS